MTDSLKSLWQDSPAIAVDAMVAQLNRNNRDIRSINTYSTIISLVVFAILVALEWTGNLHTGGMMTLLGSLCLIFGGVHYVTAKRKLQRAFSREPDALIKFMIKRTRAASNLGRMLYICPIPSVCFGYLLGAVLPDPEYDSPMPDWVDPIIFAIVIGFIAIPTWIGIWFTRKKMKELKALEAIAAEMRASA